MGNRYLAEIDGIVDSMRNHCIRLDISYSTVGQIRRENNLTVESAVEIVLAKKNAKNDYKPAEIAEELGVSVEAIYMRMHRHKDLDKIRSIKSRGRNYE